jgi:hypothetical protein
MIMMIEKTFEHVCSIEWQGSILMEFSPHGSHENWPRIGQISPRWDARTKPQNV